MKILTNQLAVIISLALILLNACTKEDDLITDDPGLPVITEFGEPLGQATEVTIGPEGGMINSSDGLLSVNIPEGALSASTLISIQPISNQAPLGVGNSYRLGPEGISFNNPVILTFHYSEELLDSNPAEFLWIVFQEGDGSWKAKVKSALDSQEKTVSAETTHFSDWSLGRFVDLTLNPVSKTLKKGEKVELAITGFSRGSTTDGDELAPLLEGAEVQLIQVTNRNSLWRAVEWTLNGAKSPVSNNYGDLQSTENRASYTAPSVAPKPNVVSVTVKLEYDYYKEHKSTFYLTSKITIYENDFFVSLDFRGKTYMFIQYGFDLAEIPDPSNYSVATCGLSENTLVLYAATFVNFELQEAFEIYIDKPARGSRGLIGLGDGGNDEMNFMVANPYAFYDLKEVIRSRSGEYCNHKISESNLVKITLSEYSGTQFSEVEGSFTGRLFYSEQTYDSECKSTIPYPISGEFHMTLLLASK